MSDTRCGLSTKIDRTFSEDEIAKRVKALGREIREDASTNEVFLLGILKGTAVLMADLLRAIDGRVSFGFIDTVRDISDTSVANALEIDFLNFIDLRGKHVYLLKDVVSTGVIESYLLTQLRQKSPADIRLVALLDRPDLRTVDLRADFFLFQVADGAFVGYGLEQNGEHGNLPFIGKI